MDKPDREELKRRLEMVRAGHQYVAEERLARLRAMKIEDTAAVMAQYDGVFKIANQKPLRQTSGLAEMYKILLKNRP